MFTREMVQKVLDNLAVKDHFFVSEAHLQTEFIIEAARLYPNYRYYPELVPSIVPSKYKEMYHDKGIHFDLIIKGENEKILIEFKYLTNTYSEVVDNMLVSVKSHMAVDIRRYDCWKDIERIEAFVKSNESDVTGGYFILVSNVPAFWNQPRSKSLDYEFHIYEGLHKKETKNWQLGASEGTVKGRSKPISIFNDYYFEYKSFYNSDKRNGEFKSLVVEINK